jgi:hypothetical protein
MIPGRKFSAGIALRFALVFALCSGLSIVCAEARKSGGKAAHSKAAKQTKTGADEQAPNAAEPPPPP